jgi:hypothetical protein
MLLSHSVSGDQCCAERAAMRRCKSCRMRDGKLFFLFLGFSCFFSPPMTQSCAGKCQCSKELYPPRLCNRITGAEFRTLLPRDKVDSTRYCWLLPDHLLHCDSFSLVLPLFVSNNEFVIFVILQQLVLVKCPATDCTTGVIFQTYIYRFCLPRPSKM